MLFGFLDIEKPVLQPPSRSVTLKEGEALEINCTSDSLPLADIKWINKSSSQVIHSNTITANPISRGDAGSYVCNASNVAGESSSDTVSVTVQCKFIPINRDFYNNQGM